MGEKLTSDLLTRKNGKKYFRHPYLHIGESKEKADSLELFLANNQYTVAPVTIDNEDYIFAAAYQKAMDLEDLSLAQRIQSDYIIYMEKKLKYFEKLSFYLFNKNIRQIIILHSNLLNAHSLEALIGIFKKNNYTFISLGRALKDKAYDSEITVYKNWGISWLERWAISKKSTNDIFKEDPITTQYIYDYIK